MIVMFAASAACVETNGRDQLAAVESCMQCHNGSQSNDYAGPGIQDPHPFVGGQGLRCTTCHGGNPAGAGKLGSHVPPPPEIGDRAQQQADAFAFFNRLTLTGIDKLSDYTVDGTTYSAMDYLQFINPGDLRVVKAGRACGQCHVPHAESVNDSLLGSETGIFSGAMYAAGAENAVPAQRNLFVDTAADLGFRDEDKPNYVFDATKVGQVGQLIEVPVISQFRVFGPQQLHNNSDYNAAALANDVNANNTVVTDSKLHALYREQIAFTCGDCHLGSAGANNRYGDFRSSGCTSCHMPYSLDGRSTSQDPNVPKTEPLDPDAIEPGERPHIRSHRIRSVMRTLANGAQIQGIDDYACAGCHQGSNRTVMQYWGIRLDQNQDVRNGLQYPANPASFTTTRRDERLFDPVVNNHTFNGRNANQYLLFEDYDGDGRDDTPADVHYEAGLGCIDCHGSVDLHGSNVNDANGRRIFSRMSQGVAIECESCHGTATAYAATKAGVGYDGQTKQLAFDSEGNVLRHVAREADGNLYLTSRLTGKKHFIPQTLDTIVDSGKRNPFTNQAIYSAKASYAMGRDDGFSNTGTGPRQTGKSPSGFSHTDNLKCTTCHSAWTNTCQGCHLKGEYNTGRNFSNITGERIVFRQRNADFVYQSPLFFTLGVGPDNKIRQLSANTKVFFQYRDFRGDFSKVFAFSDRNGNGNNSAQLPALGHNAMMAHSIRGKVTNTDEGPRYCAACHLTDTGYTQYQTQYTAFKAAMDNKNWDALDFQTLKLHFGQNTGNRLNSPLWVHMVAGLGSGLFLFDVNGCPVNKLDTNANRPGCDGAAPANNFNAANVFFNLDRIVEPNGVQNSGSTHPMLEPNKPPYLRTGAAQQNLAGPLGATLIQRLTDPNSGIKLNSWIDADGVLQGGASNFVK